jgi:hypothetical protein
MGKLEGSQILELEGYKRIHYPWGWKREYHIGNLVKKKPTSPSLDI